MEATSRLTAVFNLAGLSSPLNQTESDALIAAVNQTLSNAGVPTTNISIGQITVRGTRSVTHVQWLLEASHGSPVVSSRHDGKQCCVCACRASVPRRQRRPLLSRRLRGPGNFFRPMAVPRLKYSSTHPPPTFLPQKLPSPVLCRAEILQGRSGAQVRGTARISFVFVQSGSHEGRKRRCVCVSCYSVGLISSFSADSFYVSCRLTLHFQTSLDA